MPRIQRWIYIIIGIGLFQFLCRAVLFVEAKANGAAVEWVFLLHVGDLATFAIMLNINNLVDLYEFEFANLADKRAFYIHLVYSIIVPMLLGWFYWQTLSNEALKKIGNNPYIAFFMTLVLTVVTIFVSISLYRGLDKVANKQNGQSGQT